MGSGEFLLMSSGRKGTFLLLTALARHPEARVHQQVLNSPEYYPHDTGMQIIERIFGDPPAATRATILPVSWASARDRYPGFWESLRSRHVSLIHLHRRNMLRWEVSQLTAEEARVWITPKEPDYPRPPVFVDPGRCRRRILRDWRHERQAKRFFADHRAMDLWYEDLVLDFDGRMQAVQSFLGLTPRRLRPTCVKQENRPLSQAVANYEQLRAAWSGTPWEAFLDDVVEPGVSPIP